MKHSFVLANLGWLIVTLALVPPCRAQEVFPLRLTVPTVDSKRVQQPADSALASAQTDLAADFEKRHPFAGVFPPGADTAERRFCARWDPAQACSTAGENTNRQPSGSSGRVPTDVDFMQGNTWKQLYSDVAS